MTDTDGRDADPQPERDDLDEPDGEAVNDTEERYGEDESPA
jgi:hypothetical protein